MPKALAQAPVKNHLDPMTCLALLPDRAVIELTGEDRVAFLQGLVSNDVTKAAPGQAVWAAFLTPQGKWLADFFIFADTGRLLLDCERQLVPDLTRRLSRFRLRSKVSVRDASPDFFVHVAWSGPYDPGAAIAAPDPRHSDAGWRILAASKLPETATHAGWDSHRISLALPDGSRDLESEKSVLLEAGFDELHGVSWTKGCYMGQELTARTKYRGLIKRRLTRVSIEGPAPLPGSPIFAADREVGIMRSSANGQGLALLRIDIPAEPLLCGDASLHVQPAYTF